MPRKKKKKNSSSSSIESKLRIFILICIIAIGIYYACTTPGIFEPQEVADAGSTEEVAKGDSGGKKEKVPQGQAEESPKKTDKKSPTKKKTASKKGHSKSVPKEIEIPLCAAAHGADDHQIRHCTGFSLCYRESYEQAEWVAYELTAEELNSVTSRKDNFHADPQIVTGSAEPSDYTRSGYDRGHLAPAADLSWDAQAMDDSFFMSNMSPQAPAFNRGVWKQLEEKVRAWAKKYGSVWVVSGPVLEKPAGKYKSIGKNRVSVPEFYYKALLVQKPDGSFSAAAFILPNDKGSDSCNDYIVTVDEAERRTGLDFFSAMEDSVENAMEGTVLPKDWD